MEVTVFKMSSLLGHMSYGVNLYFLQTANSLPRKQDICIWTVP